MATLIIRNVPDNVISELDRLADQEDRSRESYIRRLLAEHTNQENKEQMTGQFSATNMSYAARQAAKAGGLARVGSFDIVSQARIVDPEFDAALMDTVVIRAYSPSGLKVVDITAGNIYMHESEYQDAPAARIS